MPLPSSPFAALMSSKASTPMDAAGKTAGGLLGGFGQSLMDQNMRRGYGTARSGGFHDLMENQQMGDFVQGDMDPGMVAKFQDIKARMSAGKRGLQ